MVRMDRWKQYVEITTMLLMIMGLATASYAEDTHEEIHCLSTSDLQQLTLSCASTQRISINHAHYVIPIYERSPPECQRSSPVTEARDLIMDLGTILNYKCQGLSECTLPIEGQMWNDLKYLYRFWQGTPFVQIEYSCTDAARHHDLPSVQLLVSRAERQGDNVHVYGCQTPPESPTGIMVQCTQDNHVVKIDSALIGKTSRPEDRCFSREASFDSSHLDDASILRDITLDLTRTVSRLCDGTRYCSVPVDWDSTAETMSTLANGYNYDGDMYLDISYKCVDVTALPKTEAPDVFVSSPMYTTSGYAVEKEKERKEEEERREQIPLIAIGVIGIVLVVCAGIGLICFSRYMRNRRTNHVKHFKDMVDPTYNTAVLRSKNAPPFKFDNIVYDADRHPSGVYDVPRSAGSTPGVSRILPPDFEPRNAAATVRVEVEVDDDDVFEVQEHFPPPPAYTMSDDDGGDDAVSRASSRASEKSTGSHSYMNMGGVPPKMMKPTPTTPTTPAYAEPYMGPDDSSRHPITLAYSEPYASEAGAASSTKSPTTPGYSEPYMVGSQQSASHKPMATPYSEPYASDLLPKPEPKLESYVRLNGGTAGQPVTILSPPNIPPRSPSMLDIEDENGHVMDNTTQTTAVPQKDVMTTPPPSSPTNKQEYASVHKNTQKATSPRSQKDIAKIRFKLPPPPSPPKKPRQKNTDTPIDDEVVDKDSDYYRSLMRRQLASGAYDNNMTNMPQSPFCYHKQ